MRKHIREAYKNYVRVELLKTRNLLKLSQEQMASILKMSGRAYTALESGQSCCSQVTLVLYLTHCCPDVNAFITGLLEAISQAEKEIA